MERRLGQMLIKNEIFFKTNIAFFSHIFYLTTLFLTFYTKLFSIMKTFIDIQY